MISVYYFDSKLYVKCLFYIKLYSFYQVYFS